MSNPAEGYSQVDPNFFPAASRQTEKDWASLLDMIENHRLIDVYIKAKDTTYPADKYNVDVYERSFALPPTKVDVEAYNLNPLDAYQLWMPAKAIIKNGVAYIVGGAHIFYFKQRNATFGGSASNDINYNKNQIEGWPCWANGNCDATIQVAAQTIRITSISSGVNRDLNYFGFAASPTLTWLKLPQPTTYDSGVTLNVGVIIGGGYGLIPIGATPGSAFDPATRLQNQGTTTTAPGTLTWTT